MQTSLATYQFEPHEVIASIGAGGGLWEIAFASTCDHLTFYLQDIQAELLNDALIQEAVLYWEQQFGKTITATFIPVIGTEIATNLHEKTFNKVLIINSLHEFLFQEIMLQDVKKILKPHGQLFVEEILAQQSGQVHEGCGKALFTETELLQLLQSQGFTHIHTVVREEFWKIFVFE